MVVGSTGEGPGALCHPQTRLLVWGKDGCQQVHLVPVCVLEDSCSAGPRGKRPF